MSTRTLGLLVLLLGLSLVATGRLALRRLGYVDSPPHPPWTFLNPLLEVEEGRRVVLRPITAGLTGTRYYFGPRIDVPEAVRGVDPDEAFLPHIRLGVEDKQGADEPWSFAGVQCLVLAQMGALTPKEWLTEIAPVLERREGGGTRLLLRVSYGHESGARIDYYFDPADPQRKERGYGWIRCVMQAPDQPPDVQFTEPAGITPPN